MLVLKRRIINEILTTYLPSILILSIVYATNFFKAFFFESIISTNLTSQLVLTTLFISVSQSLPPTAYVKMIDVWLIFSQLIPFAEVILHTYMDCLRENENREINHHGQTIAVSEKNDDNGELFTKSAVVPSYSEMVQRNEQELVEARRQFYKNAKFNVDFLKLGQFAGNHFHVDYNRNLKAKNFQQEKEFQL